MNVEIDSTSQQFVQAQTFAEVRCIKKKDHFRDRDTYNIQNFFGSVLVQPSAVPSKKIKGYTI